MSEMAKNRRKWNQNEMRSAVEDVLAKKCGYLKASKLYNVPKATVIYYCEKVKNGASLSELLGQALGRKTILPQEMERQLKQYIIEMDRR